MIYLPQSVHARLKAEATKRAVSMSEVACTAVAQFLSGGERSDQGATPQPFIGKYGKSEVPAAPQVPSASQHNSAAGVGEDTFEVEE